MYLNLYQKYILELLAEYDGLLVRQLEALVKHFKEPHIRDRAGKKDYERYAGIIT